MNGLLSKFALLLLLASPAYGQIALVTNTSARNMNVGGVGAVTSSSINTTGSNFIAIATVYVDGGTSPTCNDNKSNTYTKLTAYQNSVLTVRIDYVLNPTVGSGHTFTCDVSAVATFTALAVAAFSNVATASAHDRQAGNSATSTTVKPGSVTPTTDNQLILSALEHNQTSTTASIDVGMTITDQLSAVSDESVGIALAYKVQTSAAAIDPEWTITVSNNLAAAIETFKKATSSTSNFIQQRRRR